MSLVSIRDVRKSFGTNEVLKGVSLDIAKGDVVAIIGRSGSGKSSALAYVARTLADAKPTKDHPRPYLPVFVPVIGRQEVATTLDGFGRGAIREPARGDRHGSRTAGRPARPREGRDRGGDSDQPSPPHPTQPHADDQGPPLRHRSGPARGYPPPAWPGPVPEPLPVQVVHDPSGI